MADRCARVRAARDWAAAHDHRMKLIERHKSQTLEGLSDSELKTTPLMSVGAVHAEDLGAAKASCQSRPSGSCDGRTSLSLLPELPNPNQQKMPMPSACPSADSPKAASTWYWNFGTWFDGTRKGFLG